MDLGLSGARALVIGGTSGLGLAVAERLAEEGADLLLFARDAVRLETCRQDLEARYGVSVACVPGDLAEADDVVRLAAEVERLCDVRMLILNTPRPPSPMRDFLDETDPLRWAAACRHQLDGALLVLRAVAPLLLDRGWGRIVAITSASVKQPMPRHAISTIFRAGVQAALKHLSMEVAGRGVTVNSVAPATVLTPTFGAYHDLQRRIAQVPVGRAGRADELAATVAFLCSVHAGFITGETLQLDGGQTLALC